MLRDRTQVLLDFSNFKEESTVMMITTRRTIIVLAVSMFFLVSFLPALAVDEIKVLSRPPTHSFGKLYAMAAEIYNKRFAGKYRVKLVPQPGNVVEVAMRQFIAGEITYDVVPIPDQLYASFLPHLEPLDSYIQKARLDMSDFGGIMQHHIYNGKTYGLPWRAFFLISMYRKDLFQEAGLDYPTTIPELRAAARKLTKKNARGEVEIFGYNMPFGEKTASLKEFHKWIEEPGGAILTPDLKRSSEILISDFAVQQVEMMKSFYDEGLVPNPLSQDDRGGIDTARLGRMAVFTDWNAFITQIEDPERSKSRGKWEYRPNLFAQNKLGPLEPGNTFGGWGFSIAKASKNKEAAFEWLKLMSSPEVQLASVLNFNNGPVLISMYRNPEVLKLIPLGEVAVESMKTLRLWQAPPIPEGSQLAQLAMEEMQAMFLDKQTPKQALQKLYNRINDILKN